MPSEEERYRTYKSEKSPDQEHLEGQLKELVRKAKAAEEEALQSALSRAAQAEAEVVELRGALYRAGTNTHVACCEGGDHAPACQEIADALSSPSPVAEALGRVVEAAIELHLALKTGPQEVIDAAFDKLYCRAEALQAAHPTLNPQPPAPEPGEKS